MPVHSKPLLNVSYFPARWGLSVLGRFDNTGIVCYKIKKVSAYGSCPFFQISMTASHERTMTDQLKGPDIDEFCVLKPISRGAFG